ncbi:hypothetical protein, partial [Microbacterium sp. LWH12-1.2]|uniref:hypothetical protein n=1 Tax=Microbacterium sp. LWH12-1.2 TaxID=3135259 RepID=UPI00341A77E5
MQGSDLPLAPAIMRHSENRICVEVAMCTLKELVNDVEHQSFVASSSSSQARSRATVLVPCVHAALKGACAVRLNFW